MGLATRIAVWGTITVAVGASARAIYVLETRAQATRALSAARKQLQDETGLAHSEGIAVSAEEFHRKYLRAGSNAWPALQKASKRLDELAYASGPLWARAFPSPGRPDDIEAMRRVQHLMRPALKELAEASALPKCDLSSEPSDLGINFGDFATFKEFAKLAVMSAKVSAADGHPAEALNGLKSFAPLAGFVAQSPGMTSAMIWAAVDALFTNEISQILSRHGRDPGVAKAAIQCLSALGPVPDTIATAEWEGLVESAFLDTIQQGVRDSSSGQSAESTDPDMKSVSRVQRLARQPGMIESWRAFEIDTTRKTVHALRSAGDDWLDLENQIATLIRGFMTPDDDVHAYQILGGVKPWDGFIDVLALRVSERRVLLQAANILAASPCPSTLPLRGKDAVDPLTGRMLHYTHSATSFMIYGVGAHGVDHHGLPATKLRSGSPHDNVFSFQISGS